MHACLAALPAQLPTLNHSSSSEDESRRSGGTVVRRRRLRKNTTSVATEEEKEEEVEEEDEDEEELLEMEQSEQEIDEEPQEEQERAGADVDARSVKAQGCSLLSICLLIGLLVVNGIGIKNNQGKFQLKSFLFFKKNLHAAPDIDPLCSFGL